MATPKLELFQELVPATLILVRLRERKQLDGVGQCGRLGVGANGSICVNKVRVWRLVRKVRLEEVLEAAVVNDTLGRMHEQNSPHGWRELIRVADAGDLCHRVVN